MAVAFGCTAVFGAGVAGAPLVFGASQPPNCRYDDVMTEYKAVSEWHMTLLDPIFMVPSNYVPSKLVSVSNAHIPGSGLVRRVVIDDLAAMAAAARDAGAGLRVVSAYRSFSNQRALYRREVRNFGEVRGRESVARPGHSEHQLGTTIDFGSAGENAKAWAYSDWAKTKPGAWIKANGWKYGFLLSYPKGKKGAVCYRYEPWHFRYVGREMAADVKASGLTLREYLWKKFHQA
jgi:D-alanyl-D-alanine carboxypeptidase